MSTAEDDRDHGASNRRGIWYMVGSMACFIANDTIVKLVSARLPAGQLIFVRGLMAALLVWLVIRLSAGGFQPAHVAHRAVLLRAGLDAGASLMYLTALFHLPIASATAINMASPLFVVALAGPLLGERVVAARWWAVIAGFLGVLLIIQPRPGEFNAWSLVCLGATLTHALRDFATRRVPADVPSGAVTFATALAVTMFAGGLAIVQGWQDITLNDLSLLATAAGFLAGGYHLIILSTRTGNISTTAPWRYSGLVWALLAGWVLWGDVPNLVAWIGISLLVAAGLYLIRSGIRH